MHLRYQSSWYISWDVSLCRLVSPRVSQLGLMDYHRADEAIAEGVAAVARVRPLLRELLGGANE